MPVREDDRLRLTIYRVNNYECRCSPQLSAFGLLLTIDGRPLVGESRDDRSCARVLANVTDVLGPIYRVGVRAVCWRVIVGRDPVPGGGVVAARGLDGERSSGTAL